MILKSTHPISASPPKFNETNFDPNIPKNIFKRLCSRLTFHEGIKALDEFISKYPDANLAPYFSKYVKSFQDRVLSALDEYRENAYEDDLILDDHKCSEELIEVDPEATLEEYENRLNYFRKKFNCEINNKQKKSVLFNRTLSNSNIHNN